MKALTRNMTAILAVLNSFRSAKGAEFRHGERKGCLKGTRGAVLNSIELWARDFDQNSVYWLNGLAGTGKSTIAKTIAERLFADGRLGASFFCSRDFEDRRNLQLIFPTLAGQLARKYTEFRSILVPLIQSDPNIAYESLYDQMRKLIVQPFDKSDISTVIVIDALDECEDVESASAILSVLGRLLPEIPKVKFFLTGRPEPRISVGFRLPLLARITDVFVLHEVLPDQVDSDVRLFFRTGFSELASRRDGLGGWPTEEQLDQLCGRAAGLFVYAAAAIKFIDNNGRSPRKQLDILLRSQKIGDPEGKALDSLYMSILQDAFGDATPEFDDIARSILSAVVLATNPLSPSTIATLLGLDPDDVPPFLSLVNSLLILKEDIEHPVRSFHKSFPDFITDPARCTNQRFHVPPPDHHSRLLIRCLDLMNRTLVKNICKLPEAVANSDVSDLKERTEKYIDPALRYACTSWHTHLLDTDTIPTHTPAIAPTLRRFLETKFLLWLEVLSVLGAVRNAVDALQAIAGWLEVCPVLPSVYTQAYSDKIQGSPMLDLANDCLRFVTGYFEVIGASSTHIYHSALVLAPKKSIVWKLYGPQADPFARVVYGAPISWDTHTTATMRHSTIDLAVWSPCDRFVAITYEGTMMADLLDSVTFQRLQTLETPGRASTRHKALAFSPDSRILTCSSSSGYTSWLDPELLIVSWDLQTGGVASIVRQPAPSPPRVRGKPSIAYSADGKSAGVFYQYSNPDNTCWIINISIFDPTSDVCANSHSLDDCVLLSNNAWAEGESLRFVTADAGVITIWEVKFASSSPPTTVGTLPAPDIPRDIEGIELEVQFSPASSRLALTFQDGVLVWDFRNSKYLLHCTDTKFSVGMFFSSDGRSLACSTAESNIYLWKESPTGFILHGTFTPSAAHPIPLLSQHGESIATYGGRTIQLWRGTKGFPIPPPSISTRAPQRVGDFVLDLSSDSMLAAVSTQKDNVVTILDLKSGILQSTIDACMEVYGLGVIKHTVVVIGCRKVGAWNLPLGYGAPGARAALEDCSWTIVLGGPRLGQDVISASISLDSLHIALTVLDHYDLKTLYVYHASTGGNLASTVTEGSIPRFSPDGLNIWCAQDSGEAEVREVSAWNLLEYEMESADIVNIKHSPEGCPWGSSRGYRITDDWWILGPDGRRLLMLPPPWRSEPVRRVWKGQFLALLHREIPEPVILELL